MPHKLSQFDIILMVRVFRKAAIGYCLDDQGQQEPFCVIEEARSTSPPRIISTTSMEVSGKDPRSLNGALMDQIRLRWNREAPKLVVNLKRETVQDA